MSITDELREWASASLSYKSRYDALIAIADRIDAEHERGMNDSYDSGFDDGLATRYSEENIESLGYVRLPMDADGEVIRFGDTLELFGNRCQAHHLSLAEDGWRVYVMGEDGHMSSGNGGLYRHYHEPTVEDVLMEFHEKAEGILRDYVSTSMTIEERMDAESSLIADYAKRLRLAGEGE